MKMDTTLLQSDPEALDQDSKRCQKNDQATFLIRVQENIKCHRFIQIVKVILYIELIVATGAIGYIILSNYYTNIGYENDDSSYGPLPIGSNNSGEYYSLRNVDEVLDESISRQTKSSPMTVSAERIQVSTESTMRDIEDFVGIKQPTSSVKIITTIEEDIAKKILSDLSDMEQMVTENSNTPPTLSDSTIITVTDEPEIDPDSLSSLLLVKFAYSDELEQLIQELRQNDDESDSISSFSDEMTSFDRKRKRSAESSSSESKSSSSESKTSSSSSSSSSESKSSESTPNNKKAVKRMLIEIISKMERSNCTETTNVNVTPNDDRKALAKSLKKKLMEWIIATPVPDCAGSSPSLAVDECGNLFYKCMLHEIENEQSERHSES